MLRHNGEVVGVYLCSWENYGLDRVESEEEFVGKRLYCSRTLTVWRVYNTEHSTKMGRIWFDVEDGTIDMTIFIRGIEHAWHKFSCACYRATWNEVRSMYLARRLYHYQTLQFGNFSVVTLYRGKAGFFGNVVLSATLAEPCLSSCAKECLVCSGTTQKTIQSLRSSIRRFGRIGGNVPQD